MSTGFLCQVVVLLCVGLGVLVLDFCVVDMAVAGKDVQFCLPWSCLPTLRNIVLI